MYNDQHFISFGDSGYEKSKIRIKNEALKMNLFKTIDIYSPINYYHDNEFKNKYNSVINQNKGAGYWVWKVYFIKKKLEELKEGDYLIYCDCGCTLNPLGKERYFQYLDMLNNSKYGIISFKIKKTLDDNECLEKYWSIKEIFEYFNLSMNSEISNSHQYVGGILIMQKKKHLIDIINQFIELLEYDQNLITDYYNDKNQYSFFSDSRHDQSIWSIIRKIYGSIIIELDETYYFSELESKIPNWNTELGFKYPFWATRLSDKSI